MNRVQKHFINQALDDEDRLNTWEWDFINHLADQEDEYELSYKENQILNQIQRKLF